MATGTFKWYGKGLEHLCDADIDWAADTIKVLLTTSSYTPDQDAHDYRDDVTNEVTGTGYTSGGATLTGKAVTYDSATNQLRLRASDTAWTSSYISAKNAVVYKSRGGAASADELLGYVAFSATVTSSNGTFTLDYDNTNGLLKITAS